MFCAPISLLALLHNVAVEYLSTAVGLFMPTSWSCWMQSSGLRIVFWWEPWLQTGFMARMPVVEQPVAVLDLCFAEAVVTLWLPSRFSSVGYFSHLRGVLQ